ncbi:MAG: hypothetical protein ACFFD4_34315 [Candidatus Odinarchaeota archaeon]
MSNPELSAKEIYLRYIEEELMIKGGRWIANFSIAVRDFHTSHVIEKKRSDIKHHSTLDLLMFGGVRSRGFLLSRAYAALASPTYLVGCVTKYLDNASNIKWSSIVSLIRETTVLMESMEFEWAWLLLFGEGKLSTKVVSDVERHTSRTLGLIYADITNRTVIQSDTFIARRGAKLFDPKNLDRKGVKLKFWS